MKGLLKYLDMHGYPGAEQKKVIIKLMLLSEECSKVEFLEDNDRVWLKNMLPDESEPGYSADQNAIDPLRPRTENCMLKFDRRPDEREVRFSRSHREGFFKRDDVDVESIQFHLKITCDLLRKHVAELPYNTMLGLMAALSMQGEYSDIQTKIYVQDIQGHEKAGDRQGEINSLLDQLESDLCLNQSKFLEKEKIVYRPAPPGNGWTPLQVVGAMTLGALGLFGAGVAAKYASDHDYLPDVDLSLDTIKNWRG